MKRPEILAPAGSKEGLLAAIGAGADAVYIGGSRFGARAYAENLEKEDMLYAISYCHFHGRKLYLTVNTLMKEAELQNELIDYVAPFYEAGLDAVIVQDVGAMAKLHEAFPDLAIHASTQMSLTTGHGTNLCKEYGVTRLVPARELTLEELTQMRGATDREIEVFVHGALCYCYSGRCLLSTTWGERSGNRGRCAQPCRLPYMAGGKEGYFLSPKELCALERIPQLIEAGMDSFKIEGRMKKPAYAALTTAVYRYWTDLYVNMGPAEYRKLFEEKPAALERDLQRLLELYNREGFTKGYLDGECGDVTRSYQSQGDMLATKRPKHGGVLVGKVTGIRKPNIASIKLEKGLDEQDVVEFRDQEGKSLYEYTVGTGAAAGATIQAKFLPGSRIYKGAELYRTRKSDLIEELELTYGGSRQIPIKGKLEAKISQPLALTLEKELPDRKELLHITVYGNPVEAAKNQPSTPEQLRKQLGKTGEEMFCWESLDILCDEDCFVPVGQLKSLRRTGMRQLLEEAKKRNREDQRVLQEGNRQDSDDKFVEPKSEKKGETIVFSQKEISVSLRTPRQLAAVLEYDQVDVIYVSMEDLGEQDLLDAIDRIAMTGKKAFLMLPHICREAVYRQIEKSLQQKEGIWHRKQLAGCVCCNLEELQLVMQYREELKKDFQIVADSSLYTWNTYAARFWQQQGVDRLTVPTELTAKELTALPLQEMELIVYGHLPLMVSAQCMVRNRKGCRKATVLNGSSSLAKDAVYEFSDKKGHAYCAVSHCRYCYNTLYEKRVFSLLNREERQIVDDMPVRSLQLAFTIEEEEQVRQVMEAFLHRTPLDGEHTTGHFYKMTL